MKWPSVKLGDTMSLEYGKSLPARERNTSGKFQVAGSNGPDGKHSSAFVSSPGIVVGRKGSAGKVCWYDADFWPIDTTYYIVPKLPIDMRWVFYLLSQLHLERLSTTTGVPGLNRNTAYGLSIPLPPISEQRRIVEILDQADRLRRLRADADTKAQRILPALFIKMFGDPLTNPMGWKIGTLGDVCERITDGTYQPPPFVENGIPFLFQRHIGHLRPKGALMDSWFLCAQMNTPYVKAQADQRARGIAQKTLNLSEIRQFRVVIPPVVEQKKFRLAMQNFKKITGRVNDQEILIESLFKIILHRAFTGNLTASWREAHMKELLQEMELQAKALAS